MFINFNIAVKPLNVCLYKKLLINYIAVIKRAKKTNEATKILKNILRNFLKLLQKYFDLIDDKIILKKKLNKKRNTLKKRYEKAA